MTLEPFAGRVRFNVAPDFDAACVTTSESVAGEIYHLDRRPQGGEILTPVARFFTWRPVDVENCHPHTRVDCFVRSHPLSPEPKTLGQALASALLREGVCSEPLWISWHRSEELGGKAFGDVFELD
jgi:hypothetical protein